MAEQLTSVRFDSEMLASLRMIADVNDSNVAAEVRKAVAAYITATINNPDFEKHAERSAAERTARVKEMIAAARRS